MQFTFETKPLKLKADYAVSLKVEPVEATYDSVSLSKFSFTLLTLVLTACLALALVGCGDVKRQSRIRTCNACLHSFTHYMTQFTLRLGSKNILPL